MGTMYSRRCPVCGRLLPKRLRRTARFDTANCRLRAHRERKRREAAIAAALAEAQR